VFGVAVVGVGVGFVLVVFWRSGVVIWVVWRRVGRVRDSGVIDARSGIAARRRWFGAIVVGLGGRWLLPWWIRVRLLREVESGERSTRNGLWW
jgi:hypothetical protein